jgi:transcriptional regulator
LRSVDDGGARGRRQTDGMDTYAARYRPVAPGGGAELLAHAPLTWMVSPEPFAATLLPLRPRTEGEGRLIRLDGHLARRNPQVETLRRDPVVWFLGLGPHGYVSPSWFADRTQAPTWNYASLRVRARLRLIEDEAGVLASLADLVQAQEAGRPSAWAMTEMGPRLQRLAAGVVAFEAEVLDERPVFKLGQDERDDVYAEILAGLEATGQATLAEWMVRANPGRG